MANNPQKMGGWGGLGQSLCHMILPRGKGEGIRMLQGLACPAVWDTIQGTLTSHPAQDTKVTACLSGWGKLGA